MTSSSNGKKTDENGYTAAQSAVIADQEVERMRDALGDSVSEIELEWFGERNCHFITVEYNTELAECSGVRDAQIINTVLQSDAAVQVDSTCNGEPVVGFIPSQFAAEDHFAQAGESA